MFTLKRVLREFELLDRPTDSEPNCVFDSYVPGGTGKLIRFSRRIEDAKIADLDSKIFMGDDQIIGSGEDPRAFSWRGSACAYVLSHSMSHGYLKRLYIHDEQRWLSLIPPRGLVPGKNWTPFVRDEELYFIHSFSPFRVLKPRFVNKSDNYMLLDIVAEHRFRLPKSHDRFCRFRGGSNGLDLGGTVLGFGHTNETNGGRRDRRALVHRPFLFAYRPGQSVEIFEPELPFPPQHWVVDPTSFYREDGALFVVTCETERVWGITPQRGRICLYEVEVFGGKHEDSVGAGRRRVHRWTPREPSQIGRLLGARGRH